MIERSGGYCSLLKVLVSIALLLGIHTSAGATGTPLQMKLSANGQILTLLLQPSHVTSTLEVIGTNGSRQSVPVRSYVGKIKGDDNSWVRLTKSRHSMDGVLSRFGKRFRLQQSGNQPAKIKPLADNHDYRITLTRGRIGNVRPTIASPEVTRVAKIAIVIDSQYNQRHQGKGLEYALGLINSIDGIYREEFGLALQVVTAINVTSPSNDPFKYGRARIETMLRSFRDFRMTTALIGNDVSMVHLFTGNQPIDEPVGLAWIDTACRTDGYDVGLSTHYKHDIMLAAHEIAHNLGALHDTDTACAASSDKVMWPYISSATTQSFSSCTIETVKRSIARSCHAVVTELELASSTGTNSTIKGNISNNTLTQVIPAATLSPNMAHDYHHTDDHTTHQHAVMLFDVETVDQPIATTEHALIHKDHMTAGLEDALRFKRSSEANTETHAASMIRQYQNAVIGKTSGIVLLILSAIAAVIVFLLRRGFFKRVKQ